MTKLYNFSIAVAAALCDDWNTALYYSTLIFR